jgi:hypothetical protein
MAKHRLCVTSLNGHDEMVFDTVTDEHIEKNGVVEQWTVAEVEAEFNRIVSTTKSLAYSVSATKESENIRMFDPTVEQTILLHQMEGG